MIGSNRKSKRFYGDILVYLDCDEIVSIEVYSEFNKRARTYSEQFEEGDDYVDAKKVVGIILMEGNYCFKNFEIINDYIFVNKINYKNTDDECLEMYLVRLDKVKGIVYTESEARFIKWLRFIKAGDFKEMEKIAKGDKNMEQALKFMKRFVNDEKNLSIFDSIKDRERNAKEKGIAEGKEAGEAFGRLDEKRKTAKNMLNKGFSVQDISDLTNLTIEEIESIK